MKLTQVSYATVIASVGPDDDIHQSMIDAINHDEETSQVVLDARNTGIEKYQDRFPIYILNDGELMQVGAANDVAQIEKLVDRQK